MNWGSYFGVLRSRLLIATVIGSLTMGVVCAFGSFLAQVAMLGCYISILGGLVLEIVEKDNARDQQIELCFKLLGISRKLAQDSPVFRQYEKIVSGIAEALYIEGELFREFAIEQLNKLGKKTELLSRGIVEFDETEAWRIAYERILRDKRVTIYRSVALVTSDNYWQDEPGKRSIELNCTLQDEKGLNVERIAIVADSVWPAESRFPSARIADWLYAQHNQGIWVELVRESNLVGEPDLLADIGIYGDVAVGTQFLDANSKTAKFVLSFNPADVSLAKSRWERLKMFSIPMRKLLDQT